MWHKLLRGLGCLSYLGVLGVVFALVAYMAFSLFVRGGVTATPDLAGLSEQDAIALLADQGLRPIWSEEERFDERVAKGHVLMHDPQAGVYVKRNTEVTLTLSKGPKRIEVPDLTHRAVQAAQVSLAAAGLTLGRAFSVYSDEGASGLVVDQSPKPGERVEVDAAVDLFLAVDNPTEKFIMPDLVRLRYEDVRRFFAGAGIRIGRVRYESYGGVAPGTVLRQFPLAGHPLRRDDVIALTVVAPERAETPVETVAPDPPSHDRHDLTNAEDDPTNSSPPSETEDL